MMIKYRNLYFAAMLLVIVSCTLQKGKNEADQEKVQLTETGHVKDENINAKDIVQLNDGIKWKANTETITGINNMTALVEKGIAGNLDATKLYDLLQMEFKTIFDKCTMTGESHNQLHNFLIPIKGNLDKLKAGNPQPEIRVELHAHLLTFKNYFE